MIKVLLLPIPPREGWPYCQPPYLAQTTYKETLFPVPPTLDPLHPPLPPPFQTP
jgi:hypothetical protein